MIKEAILWERREGNAVQCTLCSHRCDIPDGRFGSCGVRKNSGGRLLTYAYGKVIADHIDPIEKKPLYHFLPGTYSYSIASAGCNFRCSFCQNWSISQLSAREGDIEGYEMKPSEIVREALANRCRSISYTYTEPTVFIEYARDTAILAREKGLANIFVTNGYMTREAVDAVLGVLDAANVDIKFGKDEDYKELCGGRLDPVLDTVRYMVEKGIWVEVTTLIVPGKNDNTRDLRYIASFIAEIDRNIPWHVTRFHPDHKMTDAGITPSDSIMSALDIGRKAGLRYVYPGNIGAYGTTVCPECGTVLVTRGTDKDTVAEGLVEKGSCHKCGMTISGIWK
ncbi:MAG: AmmeMemoRadiSam system radical SAM enzyme [Candidatus Omnitrophica bacterium]|nr:AmmeMemoRadiSam system radical SAM enzyme [Candidatus Omnitrophota bacterium]MDD5488885.1 AmmeMemoRadiSam system radical SAM enzyme [Candidatus Omnitrophota bacterium]